MTAFTAHALDNPYCLRAGSDHRGGARRRIWLGIALPGEVARHAADALLAHRLATDPPDVAADPDPPDRDFDLGIVLSLAKLSPRCRVGVLFRRSHLHDDWLRRPGVAETVAHARPGRGFDRHSHVRIIRRPLLRDGE